MTLHEFNLVMELVETMIEERVNPSADNRNKINKLKAELMFHIEEDK